MTLGTALITGASSGIGAEYARQLAARGYDLILVARRARRLQLLAEQLTQQWGISAEVSATDLADSRQVDELCSRVEQHPNLTVLINNAGFGTHGSVAVAARDKQVAMLHVHVHATYLLCRAALPAMLGRHAGIIINVSSIAGFFHSANNANYCATKAYITTFSQALAVEVRAEGIRVQVLCPGYTYSEFHDTVEYEAFSRASVPRPLWMNAEEVVVTSLAALEKDKVVVIPGRRNQLQIASVKYPPLRIMRQVAKRILRRR